MPLPSSIERQHLLAAIEEFTRGGAPDFGPSTGYDLVHEGQLYPPKAIVGLAARQATGQRVLPSDFSGGEESNRVLRKHGFTVVAKDEDAWHLRPGDKIKRTDLHQRYGGSGQSGISPSAQTPNIFIFTDPSSGEQHGYYDQWTIDGVLYYTGEGQKGDQEFRAGNRAIRDHLQNGHALRVFKGAKRIVEYLGEFAVDRDVPFHLQPAHESGDPQSQRQVIVFHLVPTERVEVDTARPELTSRVVPVEAHDTEYTSAQPPLDPVEIERRESTLVHAFKAHLEQRGYDVGRLECSIPGSRSALKSDLYSFALGALIEAKGAITRQEIRMAIGQLYDYKRFVEGTPRLAILLPRYPGTDLENLLSSVQVSCIWQTRDGFEDNAGGFLTKSSPT